MFKILGLHGSSGHPNLIQNYISRFVPDIPAYCPRGTFADGDGFTFFKHKPDFSIPTDELLDLAKNSVAPSGFVTEFAMKKLLVIGYSSGAVFAEALLAVAPHLFAGAVLLRPQPIADDFTFPTLSYPVGKPILIISGLQDNRRQPYHAPKLACQLQHAEAVVTHHALEAGHDWASHDRDFSLARTWLDESFHRV